MTPESNLHCAFCTMLSAHFIYDGGERKSYLLRCLGLAGSPSLPSSLSIALMSAVSCDDKNLSFHAL